jgi:hypothetical protein
MLIDTIQDHTVLFARQVGGNGKPGHVQTEGGKSSVHKHDYIPILHV